MPSQRLTGFAFVLVACSGTLDGGADVGTDAHVVDARVVDAPTVDAPPSPDATHDAYVSPDAWMPTCPTTAFCESFDTYTQTTLADGDTFGPWRASLHTPGAAMSLDTLHTTSGTHALHVRIENGVTAGGRLYAHDMVPLIAARPTHVYGRMRMYIDPSGTSVHWTFFGVDGPAEASSPVAGRGASYILSSLPRMNVNTFSFVDGLSGGTVYQDCYNQGMTAMPVGRWACVSFEMDSVARRLRMSLDGAPIVSVDETGQGCVAPTPGTSPWYGPEISDLFVGAWSFHDMNAPLEVWIDDLVVDTSPVSCP